MGDEEVDCAMKILVADDDPGCLWALDRLLRSSGHEVVTASDGTAAWEILKGRAAPTLALLDWVMPGLSGEELCRRVRVELSDVYRYLCLVTGRADSAHVARALNAGADDVIGKPWHVEEVLARVGAAERLITQTRPALGAFQAALDEAVRGAGGEVIVRASDVVGRVYVQQGRIAWAHVSSMPDNFHAEFGARLGISLDDWQELMRWCRIDGTNIFQALVSGKLADEETVTVCVRSYIARRIAAMTRLLGLTAVFLPEQRGGHGGLLFGVDELRVDSSKPPPGPVRARVSLPPVELRRGNVPAEAVDWLKPMMEMEGALAAAMIDLESSEAVWTTSDHAAFDAVLRAQCRALRHMGPGEKTSEMMSVAGGAWHVLIRLPQRPSVCLYFVVREDTTVPAMARIRLRQVASTIELRGAA